MGHRLTTAVAVLVAGLAVGTSCADALARATRETDHVASGNVSATLTYVRNLDNIVAPYADLHLTIARGGKTLYNAAVDVPLCGTMCWPGGLKALSMRDLEGNGQPDVLLNTYSGGEHCCNGVEIFLYAPSKRTYVSVFHVWGDPDYKLEHLDGSRQLEFVSADDRFAYAFAAYAYSGLPLQIWRLAGTRLIDVTRDYPALIRADARNWWSGYWPARKTRFALGGLAAWAADEYNLGEGATVTAQLESLEKAHELRSSAGFGPGGSGFIAQLHSFLRQTGYIH
ncbi:MAG: hypothetical protein ABSG64_11190 [Solirubrobacteraceae bacterium]|jgi:hypothetical protein